MIPPWIALVYTFVLFEFRGLTRFSHRESKACLIKKRKFIEEKPEAFHKVMRTNRNPFIPLVPDPMLLNIWGLREWPNRWFWWIHRHGDGGSKRKKSVGNLQEVSERLVKSLSWALESNQIHYFSRKIGVVRRSKAPLKEGWYSRCPGRKSAKYD